MVDRTVGRRLLRDLEEMLSGGGTARTDGVTVLWSVKGGSGATVLSVAMAAALARSGSHGDADVLLLDLMGDAPTVLAMVEPSGPGLLDWLAAEDAVTVDALDRLEHPAAVGVSLVPRGRWVVPRIERVPELLAAVGAAGRRVVIDVGVIGPPDDPDPTMAVRRAIVEGAERSLLVTRACFLSMRRAMRSGLRPHGILLVDEPGRALGPTDITDVIGVPVIATIPVDPAIARAVDAGMLAARLPASLQRALADVA